MKKSFRPFVGLLVGSGVALRAPAQIAANFNFDSLPDGAVASAFNTPQIGFHHAHYVPFLDGFGDPIASSEHWEIDTVNASLYPVTAENPFNYGSGAAPRVRTRCRRSGNRCSSPSMRRTT